MWAKGIGINIGKLFSNVNSEKRFILLFVRTLEMNGFMTSRDHLRYQNHRTIAVASVTGMNTQSDFQVETPLTS